ncbi:MAG: hypothetical protein COZ31_09735 [Nitrospirae bacterium CG_4_10_14_3_um_filter_44_29]|nr:MAG: hypothetical protein COZ31_09735 [Nitrospirae bacterium CG_4_10_14_3_um_filter_44_29]
MRRLLLFGNWALPTLLIRVCGMGVGFALNVCSARLLGTTGYGLLVIGLSILSVLVIAVCVGVDQLAIKWVALRVAGGVNRKSEVVIFYKQALLLLIISSGICSVLGLMYLVIEKNYGVSLIFALIVTPLVAFTMLNEAVIRGLRHTLVSTIASQLIRPVVSLLLIGLVFYMKIEPTISVVFILYGLGIASAFLFSHYYVNNKLLLGLVNQANLGRDSCPSLIDMLSHTKGFFAVAIISVVLNKVDIMMLGMLVSEHDVGLYAAAYSLAFLVLVVLQVVNLVIAPELASAYSLKSKVKVRLLLSRSRWIGGGLAAPLFLAMLLIPRLLLSYMGEGFVAGEVVLQVLAVGMLANALFGSVGNFLMMSGHETLFAKIMLIAVLASILLIFLVVPLYGIVGAAFAVSAVMIVWNFVAFLATQSIIRKMQ